MNPERIVITFLILLAAAAMLFVLSGCQVVYPTRTGYAVASILTNSRSIEVTKAGVVIVGAKVDGPIMAAGTAVTAVIMAGPTVGAL